MATTPVIRVDEPRELLALIPYQLGVEPRDSLVVVSVRARDRRVGLVARVDLAAFADPADGAATAEFLAARLGEDGAGLVVVVVYTALSRSEVAGASSLEGRAIAQVRTALGTVPDGGTWVVGETGYAALGCDDDACCPRRGRPLNDLQSTQVGAHMVLAGRRVARERTELRVRGEAPPGDRRRARAAAAAERARRRAAEQGTAGARAPEVWADRILALWLAQRDRVRNGLPPEPSALGRLLAGLEVPRVRDALVLTLAEEDGSACRATCLAEALNGRDLAGGVRPSEDEADAARTVLEAVVRTGSDRTRATPLATLAFVEWWSGHGARASVLVEQCLEIDPGNGLADVLHDVLASGLAPGWVTAEPAVEGDDHAGRA